jgi:hypothetical protein
MPARNHPVIVLSLRDCISVTYNLFPLISLLSFATSAYFAV